MSDARFEVQEIDHTADWAIRVRAPDLAGLFVGAATGMFGMLTPLEQVGHAEAWDFQLRAVDAETLLVDWLNELLFEADRRQIVFAQFEIASLSLGTGSPPVAAADMAAAATAPAGAPGTASIAGTARGGPAGRLSKSIKAATFSGLHITREASGFRVEIVFDV